MVFNPLIRTQYRICAEVSDLGLKVWSSRIWLGGHLHLYRILVCRGLGVEGLGVQGFRGLGIRDFRGLIRV